MDFLARLLCRLLGHVYVFNHSEPICDRCGVSIDYDAFLAIHKRHAKSKTVRYERQQRP
jgi:hypothetical protein